MPRQSEAMEVGDISQDLDQAEENDLVEDVYMYLTEGQYPVNCAANRKESSGEKWRNSECGMESFFLHQEEKQKGKFWTKSLSIYILFSYIHTSLIVLRTILWEIVLTNLKPSLGINLKENVRTLW